MRMAAISWVSAQSRRRPAAARSPPSGSRRSRPGWRRRPSPPPRWRPAPRTGRHRCARCAITQGGDLVNLAPADGDPVVADHAHDVAADRLSEFGLAAVQDGDARVGGQARHLAPHHLGRQAGLDGAADEVLGPRAEAPESLDLRFAGSERRRARKPLDAGRGDRPRPRNRRPQRGP